MEAETEIESLKQEKATLQRQLTQTSSAALTEAQNQLSQKDTQIQQLQQDYGTMETTLQNTISELKQKEKIIVK